MSAFITAIGDLGTSLVTNIGTVAIAALGVGAVIFGIKKVWGIFKGVAK